jgi:hypothetical protein
MNMAAAAYDTIEARLERQRELDQILKAAGAWLLSAEMDEALYSLRSRQDHEVACGVWEGFLMSLHEAVSELTRQRDEAMRARDDARQQLQAIGRKAFWASK